MILWSLPAKICQSHLSLVNSHWVLERILTSAFHWLAEKKWYEKLLLCNCPKLRTSIYQIKGQQKIRLNQGSKTVNGYLSHPVENCCLKVHNVPNKKKEKRFLNKTVCCPRQVPCHYYLLIMTWLGFLSCLSRSAIEMVNVQVNTIWMVNWE